MAQLHDLDAVAQAEAIRRREISPTDIVDHYLDRVDRLNDQVGAFVTVTANIARAQARSATTAVLNREHVPPLHGVPIAIKDLRCTAGVPTRFGSAVFADLVPAIDDHVVTLMHRCGAIGLGKTNVPEFGLPCYTESDIAPPARTPWDVSRGAGGSSGGSAAAVSAGLVPVALGSDGGGSIRIPASACGLVGLKVSRGRVSDGPLGGDVTGFAVNGPLTRSVRDAAALLDAIAGRMSGDLGWAPKLVEGETFLSWAQRDVQRLRIGRYLSPVIPAASVHADCRDAWEDASNILSSLGHVVEDIPPPFGPDLVPKFETVWAAAALLREVDPRREAELRPFTRWLRGKGAMLSAGDYVRAAATIDQASRQAVARTAEFDAVLTPTLAMPPVKVGWFTQSDDPADDFHRQKLFAPYTAAYNMTGQPAINLPLYWNRQGLPIGIQLVGSPNGEGPLIALSAQLEAARPWRSRVPPCW